MHSGEYVYTGDQMRGPNYYIEANEHSATETTLQSFDSLVGTQTTTKQRIIDKYISGSDSIELNIDFREYGEFIHFSSAKERLDNFKYKMTRIEHYASKSSAVSTGLSGLSDPAVTASNIMVENKLYYNKLKDDVVSSFDDYESYLYFNSHSYHKYLLLHCNLHKAYIALQVVLIRVFLALH